MPNTAFVAYGGGAEGAFSEGDAVELYVSYGAMEPDGTPVNVNKVIINPSATDDADSIRVKAAAAVRNDLSDSQVTIVFVDQPGTGAS